MKRREKTKMKILYKQYLGLKIRKLLGYKTFRVEMGTICTKDNIITVGGVYQYREGGLLEKVIIEDIRFKDLFLELKVWFTDQKRYVICTHIMVDCGYPGMWRIWDKDHYDIDEWHRDHNRPVDQALLDSIPVIYLP